MINFGYQPQQGQGYSQQEGNFQPSQGYPQPAPIYPQPVRMYPQQGGNAQPQMGQGPYTLPSGFQQPVNTQGYSLQPMPLQRTDDWPVFGCDFKTAIQRFFRKYAVFHGRASRSEYWFAQFSLPNKFLGAVDADIKTVIAACGSAEGILLQTANATDDKAEYASCMTDALFLGRIRSSLEKALALKEKSEVVPE